ncbi:toll/interleukin-1 receptor domain-containing protein [Streptomyces fildesensis]|uniref:Toll/interleukin-1 receptor domain-containing protein n=1 Tax=Streptomyces fildesensis TaxID=375757 RepID=A0ABW8C110_9ACTN
MPRVFLSFRKADSRWMRDRVYQALTDRFGANEVFKSGESIPAGADFAEILRRQAAECELMLVLIGPAWLDARGDDRMRLIDRAHDWVRVEIETALKAGNRVVPVLLGDATMLPEASALPHEIAHLARLQFLRVPETHLAEELDRLCAAVADLMPDIGRGVASPTAPAAPAAEPRVTMTARVSGGGSAYQAAGDQTIKPA